MSNKNAIILLSVMLGIIVIISGVMALRYYTPPKFKIISYDRDTRKGMFEFGDKVHTFEGNKPGTFFGRNGYRVDYLLNDDTTKILFGLYRNGKYIKQLGEQTT